MLVAKLGHGTTNVPYAITRGPTEGPYLNLKRFPNAIDDVPELRDWPELRSLVQVLNRADSGAHTIGCAKLLDVGAGAMSYVQWVLQPKRKRTVPRYAYELFHAWADKAEYSRFHDAVMGTFEITFVTSPVKALEGWSTAYKLFSPVNNAAALAAQGKIWCAFEKFIVNRFPL